MVLKIVLLLVTLAVAVALVLAAFRPDRFRVMRGARLQAPPEKIFPFIDSLREQAKWLPYYRKDPAIRLTYGDRERGPGAQVAFMGNKEVGAGRVSITDSAAPRTVAMRLEMFKPFAADNAVTFTLTPRGGATEVTWAMEGRQPFLARLVSLFVDMDAMIGRDFDAGLAKLEMLVMSPQETS